MGRAKPPSKNRTAITSEGQGVKAGDQLLVVARGERVIVIEKPRAHHKAIRGLGAGLYPAGYLAKERKSWG